MATVRREVWALGAPWNNTLLWYARAVARMLQRPITMKTSWRYLAAMHGFEPMLWNRAGYLGANEQLPPAAEQRHFWRQCQHQSWYFFPWHRAYLWSFEAIVRAAVVELGGPADWSLPYWNYSARTLNALRIPPAFLARQLPNGEPNRLFVRARFGTTQIRADLVDLRGRLEDNDFVGVDFGVGMAVGGPRTAFSHSGLQEGLVEAQPHDVVHGAIGGRGGLMSDPRLAALDPIFWLHHANIDRLWEVWRRRSPRNRNPEETAWLNGPADRAFAIFGPDGNERPARPRDVLSTTTLGYSYDDTSDPLTGISRLDARLEGLEAPEPAPAGHGPVGAPPRGPAVSTGPEAELLGASGAQLALGANPATSTVKVAAAPARRVTGSMARAAPAGAPAPKEPDRVFLNLENIRGQNGSALFDVYLGPKAAADGAAPVHVGVVSLFGLEQASDPNAEHGGRGLTKVLEVTQAVDALHLAAGQLPAEFEVRIVPQSDVRDEDRISVGQISLYRKGG